MNTSLLESEMKQLKPDDSVIREGLRIERYGRHMYINTHRTPEQQAKINSVLSEMKKSLPSEIKKEAEELENKLQKFNPLDIISFIMYKNIFVDPETYKEYSHEGLHSCVEYLTLLCMKKSFWKGKVTQINSQDLKDIQFRIDKIFNDTMWFYIAEHTDTKNLSTYPSLERLRWRAKMEGLLVRSPGYIPHLIIVLKKIFSNPKIEKWLQENLKLKIDDIIDFCKAIHKLINLRLNERRNKSKEKQRQLLKELELFRKGKWEKGECPEDILKKLARLSKREAIKNIKSICIDLIFLDLGDTFSFTPKQLAELAGKPIVCAESFLQTFSLEFGSIKSDFFTPSPTHELKLKPIIHYNDKYLCSVPYLLLWSIRPLIEKLLNPKSDISINKDNRLWEKYQQIRSDYLVNETMNLLKNTLRSAEVYHKLKYTYNEQGNSKIVEMDALIIFDKAIFLIECKAGSMTDPVWRGAAKRIKTDLKKLLGESHSQALRAKKYIVSTEEPTFYLQNGNEIKIDKSNIDMIFLVTVNLESLDVFTPVLYEVAKLGIFEEGDFPWAISILDLFVISELIEFPSQLIHFILRRLRINDLAMIRAHDELDYFGHYLIEGLHFEHVPVKITTYTTLIDDYYLYITGERRTPASKPTQKMPKLFKRILSELEEYKPSNYLTIACSILEMSFEARKKFCNSINDLIKKTRREGRSQVFSMMSKESKIIITFMCAKNIQENDLESRLYSYGISRKHQMKSYIWIGIGSLLKKPKFINSWIVIK